MSDTAQVDPDELADLALSTAREAAALVRRHAGTGVRVAQTKTSATDAVTEVDVASERLVRDLLLTARPDDSVLGEEGDDVVGTSGVRWVVDPIDGTVNFLYGLPTFAVSIAAEVDGGTVVGVVIDVLVGTEFVARPGPDGRTVSTRDDVPLQVRERVDLAQRLIGTGFSYRAEVRALQGAALARLLPRVRDVRRIGSAALDLCLVAQGSLDGYLEEGTQPWDRAAGGLIARAAGARVELTPGVGGLDLLVCGPSDGFEDLWQAAHEVGFAASSRVVDATPDQGE